jgi:hypothetical protein
LLSAAQLNIHYGNMTIELNRGRFPLRKLIGKRREWLVLTLQQKERIIPMGQWE